MSRIMNLLGPHKQQNESHFRVHFYLRQVYYSSEKRLQYFLEQIFNHLSAFLAVSIVQVHGSLKRYVDISVGAKNQQEAITFLEKHQIVKLPGESRNMVDHEIIVAEAFKIYWHKVRTSTQVPKQPPKQEAAPLKQSSRHHVSPQISHSRGRSPDEPQQLHAFPSQPRPLSYHQKSPSSSSEEPSPEPLFHFTMLVFGIPLEFNQKDIVHALSERKVRVKYCEWRMRQDMQFLLVQLKEGLAQTEVEGLELWIERYPLLVAVRRQEQSINDILMRHQVEINFDKDVDQISMIKVAAKAAGVIVLIKDEFYGPRKYVAVVTCGPKLNLLADLLPQLGIGFQMSKPQYIVRVCRMQRFFTLSHMLQHLPMYEQQVKKIEEASRNIEEQ